MRAMILAAGFGTRLRPLTDSLPKALVPVHGAPLLAILLNRLVRFGFNEIAINAHYRATQIEDFLIAFSKNVSAKLHFSYEPKLLDTGGGIKKMLKFFPGDSPLLVHNVDILSDLDLSRLLQTHAENNNDATLVVNSSQSDRALVFDDKNRLLGRASEQNKNCGNHYGFCGIQVIQPFLFRNVRKDVFYSIDTYIEASKSGHNIAAYSMDNYYWQDIGSEQDLLQAQRDIKERRLII